MTPRWLSPMPYRVKERIRGSLQPEEKNQTTDEEADAYQPIDELRLVDKPCERVLDCYLWRFSLILVWGGACFWVSLELWLPSLDILGGVGAPYLSPGSRSSCT